MARASEGFRSGGAVERDKLDVLLRGGDAGGGRGDKQFYVKECRGAGQEEFCGEKDHVVQREKIASRKGREGTLLEGKGVLARSALIDKRKKLAPFATGEALTGDNLHLEKQGVPLSKIFW